MRRHRRISTFAALAIVLRQLIVLRTRRMGWLPAFGVAMASVFGCGVVAAPWWGVNPLGVELQSNGFKGGVAYALLAFLAVETLVLAAGAAHRFLGRSPEVSNGEAVG